MFRFFAFAGLLLALLPAQASAQQPTQAQRDAIRAACRTDFMANCSGVQPGGKEAFECLVRNNAKLSAPCQAAVNAAAPKPAEPAATAAPEPAAPANAETAPPATKVERAPPGIEVAPTEAQNDALKTVQQACTLNDFVTHCAWIAPNNPEILLCLKGNAADLSPNCQAAVQSLPAASSPAAAASPPTRAGAAGSASQETGRAKACRAGARQCTACSGRRRRPGRPDSATESRHPRRMPVRFHVSLLRRAARRRRSVAMPQAQRGAALGSVPQRCGCNRRRRTCGSPIRSTGGNGCARPHRTDADAAPTRRAGDRANLRR